MIRQLLSPDSEKYYRIRLRGLELHPEAFATGAEDWRKATDEQVKGVLDKSSKDDFLLGSFQGSDLVGVIGLKRERKHSVSHKGTVWGFFVEPTFRKQGIGKALLGRLIEVTRENPEIDYLRALVTGIDSDAAKVFTALGFSRYGVEVAGIKVGDHYFDQSYVRLDLK